ncbi:MAG: CHASE domain-containing protein [Magnetococcales bacterium]|nr:CHASE domain-containing protein [Magnetococcales bacterium]
MAQNILHFFATSPRLIKRYRIAAIGAMLGVVLSGTLFSITLHNLRNDTHHAFHMAAAERFEALRNAFEEIDRALTDIASFHAASGHLSQAGFRTFVTPLLKRQNGLRALEWAPGISHSERTDFEAKTTQTQPHFTTITERASNGHMVPAGIREMYYPVTYLEPNSGNEAALGFDLFSDSIRRQALEIARDRGQSTATERIRLVQDPDDTFSFLVIHPIYQTGQPTNTMALRRTHFKGAVLGVYRIAPLFEGALHHLQPRGVSIMLHDGTNLTPNNHLFAASSSSSSNLHAKMTHAAFNARRHDELHYVKQLKAGGRIWTFTASPGQAFLEAEVHHDHWIILTAGLLFTALLTAYLIRSIQTEDQSNKRLEFQRALATLLSLSLSDTSLHSFIHKGLELLLSVSWLSLQNRGAVFLTKEGSDQLYMATQIGLNETLQKRCAVVEMGECLCGRSAQERSVLFSDHVDQRHEIRLSGMKPHGHYVIPLLSGSQLLGVITLYVDEGHPRTEEEESFLLSFAHSMSSIIKRRQTEMELIQAHTKTQERETHIRAIMDNALDAIISLDHKGRIIAFNPAAESLFGYSTHSVMGQDAAKLIIPSELRHLHTRAITRYSEIFRRQTAFPRPIHRRMESRGLRIDGEEVDLEIALTSSVSDDQIHYTAFLHDITDRKQLLKSLEETLDVAETANRAKNDFLANMSHEIRTPMNAIIGMTDLVINTPMSMEEQTENLLIVQNSSQTLLALINAILDISKIEAGQLVLEKTSFDTVGQVEQALETMAIKAHEKGLELYADIAADVPETLVGDPLRLRQIIINLVGNAIKFTTSGEVVVTVQRQPDERLKTGTIGLHFSVSDTGVGIPEDKLAMVFESFTQADGSTTRKHGGSGLGLTICRHLVTMMNGQIHAESKPDSGSIFHFTARFGIGHRAHLEPHSTAKDPRHGAQGDYQNKLNGNRVLIADCHATGRRILQQILKRFGAITDEAADGLQLQSHLQEAADTEQPYDVVLMEHDLLEQIPSSSKVMDDHSGFHNLILLLHTEMTLEHFAHLPWTHNATVVKEPARRFRLANTIKRAIHGPSKSATTTPSDTALPSSTVIPLNILLVEDLEDNQILATTILQQDGHQVTLAHHGREALDYLAKDNFDLVLMDLQMPEMDGLEATRQIRAASPGSDINADIPILAVSAKVLHGEDKMCLQSGMNGFLRKPYRPDELRQAIAPFQPIQHTGPNLRSIGDVSAQVLHDPPGNPEETAIARDLFLERSEQHLHSLTEALAGKKLQRALTEVDWLKHSAKEIGARKLAVQSMRIKGLLELKEWTEAEQAAFELGNRFNAVIKALQSTGKTT